MKQFFNINVDMFGIVVDKALKIAIWLDKHSMIWLVKCVLTCLLLNLKFWIGGRYSTCLFTGVHQCTKRTIHPSMHILDHSQGLFMFEETVLRLYYYILFIEWTERDIFMFLLPYFPQMPFESHAEGSRHDGSFRWNIISRSLTLGR